MTACLAGRVTRAVVQARDSWRGRSRAGGLGRRWPCSRRAGQPQPPPRCITTATACQWELTGTDRLMQLPHLAGACRHGGPTGAAAAAGRGSAHRPRSGSQPPKGPATGHGGERGVQVHFGGAERCPHLWRRGVTQDARLGTPSLRRCASSHIKVIPDMMGARLLWPLPRHPSPAGRR